MPDLWLPSQPKHTATLPWSLIISHSIKGQRQNGVAGWLHPSPSNAVDVQHAITTELNSHHYDIQPANR